MQAQSEFEKELSRYVRQIDRIDGIVAEPVRTLIDLGFEPWEEAGEDAGSAKSSKGKKRAKAPVPERLYLPPWIAEDGRPDPYDPAGGRRLWLTTAQCCGTLQRVWRERRRYRWLEGDRLRGYSSPREALGELRKRFAPTFRPQEPGLAGALPVLYSPTYGSFNVFSAAQVFRVLVNEGEAEAHGGLGFLSFFRMVWSLKRRFPDELSSGAALSNLPPSAYVTAKCLLPIHRLTKTCWRRRRLFEKVASSVERLERSYGHQRIDDTPSGHWQFSIQVECLARVLDDLSQIAINRPGFREAAAELRKIVTKRDVDLREDWKEVKRFLAKALADLSRVTKSSSGNGEGKEGTPGDLAVLDQTEQILDEIDQEIVGPLVKVQRKPVDRFAKALLDQNVDLGDRIIEQWSKEVVEWDGRTDYARDLARSAKESLGLCRFSYRELDKAAARARDPKDRLDKKDPENREVPGRTLAAIFRHLARANDEVAKRIDRAVSLSARWCRGAVEREIAHVSAGNWTDFDPAELVSGLAVAVRWGVMSREQVGDAVRRAVEGAREDGSWSTGQPFYSRDYSLNVSVPTSEIVGLLAGALSEHPQVREADAVFSRYVGWLERTKVRLRIGGRWRAGWPSDRSRVRRRIDLGPTALAVSALLIIRDLLEFRLWELCEERFTVIEPRSSLDRVDPVDLDAPHEERLHHRLLEMARLSGGGGSSDPDSRRGKAAQEGGKSPEERRERPPEKGFEDAPYSLVLHGPPGSSKTTIAEAIAHHSWTASQRWGPRSRLVRITPADFTRGGEDRIDLEARLIFELLGHLRGVTVLFDEIDDLLRKRPASREQMRFLDLVVPAMLNRLADLRDACPRQEICFLVATNFIEKIDPALIRKGRIDDPVCVGYPDWKSREMMFGKLLDHLRKKKRYRERRTLRRWSTLFVERTAGWPWKTIDTALETLKHSGRLNKSSLEGVLDDLKRSFNRLDYTPRVAESPESTPLLTEYALHLLSLRSAEEGGPEPIVKQLRGLQERVKASSGGREAAESAVDRIVERMKEVSTGPPRSGIPFDAIEKALVSRPDGDADATGETTGPAEKTP